MKKSYSIKALSLILLLSSFSFLANAVEIRDTKTGVLISQGNSNGSTPGGPLSITSGTIVNTNNGWNNLMISSIGQTGSNFYAQSFIANVTEITSFGAVIQEISSQGEVILAIASDNGGVPNYSTPLYVGSLKNPTTTASWYYETGLNIPVNVGQKYYVLIDGYNNPGATGYSAMGLSDVQPIPGEPMIWSNTGGSGSWSSYPTWNLAIYVEGTPPPVPVPYWAIALLFVALGVGTYIAFKRKNLKQAI